MYFFKSLATAVKFLLVEKFILTRRNDHTKGDIYNARWGSRKRQPIILDAFMAGLMFILRRVHINFPCTMQTMFWLKRLIILLERLRQLLAQALKIYLPIRSLRLFYEGYLLNVIRRYTVFDWRGHGREGFLFGVKKFFQWHCRRLTLTSQNWLMVRQFIYLRDILLYFVQWRWVVYSSFS